MTLGRKMNGFLQFCNKMNKSTKTPANPTMIDTRMFSAAVKQTGAHLK